MDRYLPLQTFSDYQSALETSLTLERAEIAHLIEHDEDDEGSLCYRMMVIESFFQRSVAALPQQAI